MVKSIKIKEKRQTKISVNTKTEDNINLDVFILLYDDCIKAVAKPMGSYIIEGNGDTKELDKNKYFDIQQSLIGCIKESVKMEFNKDCPNYKAGREGFKAVAGVKLYD